MENEELAARDLAIAIERAKRFGITPSWSSRAWGMGWAAGLVVGAIMGMVLPIIIVRYLGFHS